MNSAQYEILTARFGFSDFREGQEEIISAVLAGQDVLAVMPTGSGKSLCYQLPALLFPGVTMVVSPLIALMKDQVDALVGRQIPASFINSTLSLPDQLQRIRQVREGPLKLVYVAPERFRNQRFMEGIRGCSVSLLAVDEAHCVSEWGHDFRPDYLRLREARTQLGQPPVVALTATATPEVRRDIIEQLGLDNAASFVTGFDRPNLCFRVQEVEGEQQKLAAICRILEGGSGRGIVYAATRKNVEKVAAELRFAGHRAGTYHAGMELEERRSVQDAFMKGDLPVVAATNAFGMGIDKADLRFVIHYDVPGSLEAYYQEVGRAGRDGQAATCLLLFNFADTFTQEFFIDGGCPPLELIRSVYAVLCKFGRDDVEATLREIGELTGQKKVNEMSVSSSLKLLEKSGYIERGTGGEPQARITLRVAAKELREHAKTHETQRAVVEHLVGTLQAVPGRAIAVTLEELAQDLDLSGDQVRRSLAALKNSGAIAYQPPFRGRGVRIFQRVPPQRLDVNYSAVERRAQFERRKLRRMVDYAYSPSCLRRAILEYFGESVSHLQCRNCSKCEELGLVGTARPLSDEEVIVVKKCLSCVARMKGKYGKARVAQVLTGSRLKVLGELQLTRLSTYGLLQNFTQPEVQSVLDALLTAGLLKVEGSEYPVIQLTQRGRAAMVGQAKIQMVFPLSLSRQPVAASVPPADAHSPYPTELFERLREMRRNWAERLRLPPFVIFHDETLRNICRKLPKTLIELRNLKGIGERKVDDYGEQIVRLVKQFRGTPPGAVPSPSAEERVGISPAVEETWKLWQQGKTPDQIAAARGLVRATVLGHLETLIEEGRHVELARALAPERIANITAAVARARTDQLTPIKELLPADITFDEIRLVKAQEKQNGLRKVQRHGRT